VFNFLPIVPMDGGHIVHLWLAKRFPEPRATAVSAGLSLVFVGLIAVAAFLWLRSILLFFFIALFGWTNIQRIRAAQAAAGKPWVRMGFDGFREEVGRGGTNGDRPRASATPLHPAGQTLAELAADTRHMRALLQRSVEVGFGYLSSEERRLIVFHRNQLEQDVVQDGYEGLSAEKRELLALHHALEGRERPPH